MWVVLDAGGIETRNECLRQLELGTGSRADDQWRATEVAQGTAVEGETSEIHSVVVGTGQYSSQLSYGRAAGAGV